MSADKHKSLNRRLRLLEHMEKHGRIYIHCEGGMAFSNPDLQRLLSEGLATFTRKPYGKIWANDRSYNRRPDLRRSLIYITSEGREFFQRNKS